MSEKSVTFPDPGRLCLGSCNDRFSFFPVEIPVAVLRTRPVTCTLFRPYGGTASRMHLLLGRHRSCTKLPCSASLGAWTTLLPLPVARSPKLHSRHRDRRLRVGPRFECLQTKRCAYLWYARYPCSIFHTLVSRLFNHLRSQRFSIPLTTAP